MSLISRFLIITVNSVDIRRIKGVVDNLYIEKQKMEKEKLKKPKKGGGKPKLRMESSVSRILLKC